MGLADQIAMREASVELPLDAPGLAAAEAAAGRAGRATRADEVPARAWRASAPLRRHVHVRYQGTDTALPVPWADPARSGATSRPAYRQRFAFLMPGRGAGDRGGVGRGRGRRRAPMPTRAGEVPPRRRPTPDATRAHALRRAARTPACSCASALRRRHVIDGPAIIAERNATTVVEPGWQATLTAAGPRAAARAAARHAARHRHRGRPGDAGGLQQPVHEHRRADGAAAAEHRLLGQHQGAAGLLLRAVRRRGRADRQRAAHAGAPGLDERVDQDRDRAQPGMRRATSTCSTTRTTAARTCPT
jgi:hypothetical protein